MTSIDDYDFVCSSGAELNSVVKKLLRPELARGLGKSVSDLFPAFANAFPLTVQIMEKLWPSPVAAFRRPRTVWFSYLVAFRQDGNLFFNMNLAEQEIDGPLFEKYRNMLPEQWVENYRYFNSFVVSDRGLMPLTWIDTPFSSETRLPLEEYRQNFSLQKSKVRKFRDDVGSSQLTCWLLTSAGDALFLDEQRCDKKVYHVRHNDFENYFVIENPGVILDGYLAHCLEFQSPDGFDFRR